MVCSAKRFRSAAILLQALLLHLAQQSFPSRRHQHSLPFCLAAVYQGVGQMGCSQMSGFPSLGGVIRVLRRDLAVLVELG